MTNQEREKARRMLDALATWPATELKEEFSKWTPEKLAKWWSCLERPYRQMCRAFGLASSRQRMSARGQYTHKQIKRLMVLQRHAMGVSI